MGQELSVVGQRLPRVDAPDKAKGVAKFAADLKLTGTLIGKALRSPYPHAKIRKINASKAENLFGVAAVVTHRDIPKVPFNRNVTTEIVPGSARMEELDD